ncbi:MAG: hypothetical protein ACKVHP_09510, partial [Verrucomicrobiales bacterium]
RAQLVSFLDREKPITYVKDIGAMERIMNPLGPVKVTSEERVNISMAALREGSGQMTFPTRLLTEIEAEMLQNSLKSLQPVADVSQKEMIMVAPVIARKSCLRCHEVKLDAPLGTFSYAVVRD